MQRQAGKIGGITVNEKNKPKNSEHRRMQIRRIESYITEIRKARKEHEQK